MISCSLGDWSQAACTGAERKTWPSQRLFKISPVRKRVEGTATDDEIAESLRGLMRAQLQKIAKTLWAFATAGVRANALFEAAAAVAHWRWPAPSCFT